jgi:hypothetical protein
MPLASHATAQISLTSMNCSGDMALSSGSGISLSCAGNLNVDGGWLKSGSHISLFANGDLILSNLSLYAPEISLSSLAGTITISNNALFDTTRAATVPGGIINIDSWLPNRVIEWQDFNVGLNPGGVITVGSGDASGINHIPQQPVLAGSLSINTAQSVLLANASQIRPISGANINVSSVPEPEGYMMMLAGLGLMAYRRKAKEPGH